MPKSVKVLPCPFCGSAPKLYDNSEQHQIPIMLKCENSLCNINPEVSCNSYEDVEACWNTRDLYRSDSEEMKTMVSLE